jgi:hypothetical protein
MYNQWCWLHEAEARSASKEINSQQIVKVVGLCNFCKKLNV